MRSVIGKHLEEAIVLVTVLSVGPIGTNAYVVGCETTLEGMIVDPGGHAERILAAVQEMRLKIKYVINTHAHFDHVGANRALIEATDATLVIHPDEVPVLKAGGGARWFGLSADPSPEPGLLVHDGDTLQVGRLTFQVIHAPGHSPGIPQAHRPGVRRRHRLRHRRSRGQGSGPRRCQPPLEAPGRADRHGRLLPFLQRR